MVAFPNLCRQHIVERSRAWVTGGSHYTQHENVLIQCALGHQWVTALNTTKVFFWLFITSCNKNRISVFSRDEIIASANRGRLVTSLPCRRSTGRDPPVTRGCREHVKVSGKPGGTWLPCTTSQDKGFDLECVSCIKQPRFFYVWLCNCQPEIRQLG